MKSQLGPTNDFSFKLYNFKDIFKLLYILVYSILCFNCYDAARKIMSQSSKFEYKERKGPEMAFQIKLSLQFPLSDVKGAKFQVENPKAKLLLVVLADVSDYYLSSKIMDANNSC